MDQGIKWRFDSEVFSGDRMMELERFGLEEHAGGDAVFCTKLVAPFDFGVAVVSDDGKLFESEVTADLMESSAFRAGLDEGEFGRDFLKNSKMSLRRLGFTGGVFCERLPTIPLILIRESVDDGEVGLVDFVSLESEVQFACDVAIGGEEKDSRSRSVETVDRINLPANLIAEDLHRDFVVGLWLVGRDDHLPGGFVHRDDPLILEKNIDGLGLQRAER